jgi:hypothetical protein
MKATSWFDFTVSRDGNREFPHACGLRPLQLEEPLSGFGRVASCFFGLLKGFPFPPQRRFAACDSEHRLLGFRIWRHAPELVPEDA